jgi:predicted amidophosphoribosyltransferase
VRGRGYDHALALARHAAGDLQRDGLPAAAAPVLRLATGAGQVGLGAAARRANRQGAMQLRRLLPTTAPAWHGTPVVVVDDIATTGTSLGEAARVLRVAGADVLGAAVVARVRSGR